MKIIKPDSCELPRLTNLAQPIRSVKFLQLKTFAPLTIYSVFMNSETCEKKKFNAVESDISLFLCHESQYEIPNISLIFSNIVGLLFEKTHYYKLKNCQFTNQKTQQFTFLVSLRIASKQHFQTQGSWLLSGLVSPEKQRLQRDWQLLMSVRICH